MIYTALSFRNAQNLNKAEYYYLQANGIYKNKNSKSNLWYAYSLIYLSELYQVMGKLPQEEPLYIEALKIYKTLLGENHPNYAIVLNNMALLCRSLGDYSKGVLLCKEAIKTNKIGLNENNSDYALSLNNLAGLYSVVGNYSTAESLYLDALKIRKSVLGEYNQQYATSLSDLGQLYLRMGNYSKAETIMLDALLIFKSVLDENHQDYATPLNNLALLYYFLGNYSKAESISLDALKIQKTILGENHADYALSLNNLSGLYQRMGNYSKAEPLLLDALKIYKNILGENHPFYAASLNNLAMLNLQMGNYSKAEPLYLEALKIYKTVLDENNSDYVLLLNNLALLYYDMGNFSKAEPFYLDALRIYKTAFGDNYPDYANSLNNLALLYESMGNSSKAEPLYKQANKNLNNQIRQNFSFMSETEKELFVKTIGYKFDEYHSFSLRYKSQKPDFVTLNYNNELAHKGMILQSNMLLQQTIMNSNNPDLIAGYDNLINIKKMLAKQYTLPIEKRTLKTDSLENIANTLEKNLTTKMQSLPDFKEISNFNSSVSWSAIQKALKPGEAAIEFASFQYRNNKRWTNSIYYCALVSRKEFSYPKMIYLCEERQLQALLPDNTGNSGAIDNLYNLQGTRTDNAEGYLLYKLIWQPIDSVLQGIKTVYFAPSGLLHKIAFNAIATPEKNYLSDKYHLQTFSTTAVLTRTEQPFIAKQGMNTVVYGGIKYSIPIADMVNNSKKYIPNQEQNLVACRPSMPRTATRGGVWSYLPGTLNEAQGINNLFVNAKLNNTFLTGPTANEESFKGLAGKISPSIIHIATHGFFMPDPEKNYKENELEQKSSFETSDNPLQRAGLLFAGANHAWNSDTIPSNIEDGILTAQEISNLYLPNTKLVVLSACETGLGKIKGGEGVFGLQRAFKMAGINYILMSLWQVPDEQTSELMQAFYKNWLSGKAVRESFTEAQNQLKQKYSDSPFSWAAFVLIN